MDLREQVKRLKGLIKAQSRTNQRLTERLRATRAENQALRQDAAALELEIERLRIETFTDPLTGAYNRTGLRQVWTEVVKEVTAVMIIDADRFKQVNDRYGHRAGDIVICHVCDAIRSCGIIVARTMGDEFIGLVTDPAPEKVAEQIRETIARPRSVNGNPVTTTATIGLCLVDQNNSEQTSMIECLDRADAALYQGKHAGRNTVVTVTTR